jgi:hypothetical protein
MTSFDVVMHLGIRLVRSPDLGLLVRRIGVAGLLAAGALAIVAPAPAPHRVDRRATGRIEGAVEISPSLTARRPQYRFYADPGSGSLPPAPPRDPVAAELRNVVIYLEGDSARLWSLAQSPEPRMRTTIAQRDERFVPHVRAVVQGATVDFPNEDDVFHNVFSLSAAASQNGRGFDLGRYPRGSSRSVTFVSRVSFKCSAHSRRHGAFSYGCLQPVLRVPSDDHRFVIDDVPEGDYTIVGWRTHQADHQTHPRLGRTDDAGRLQHSAPAGWGQRAMSNNAGLSVAALGRRARRSSLGVKLGALGAVITAAVLVVAIWALSIEIRTSTRQQVTSQLARDQRSAQQLGSRSVGAAVCASLITQTPTFSTTSTSIEQKRTRPERRGSISSTRSRNAQPAPQRSG